MFMFTEFHVINKSLKAFFIRKKIWGQELPYGHKRGIVAKIGLWIE